MTMGDRIAVLKDGVLQQCAPPREVYDKPSNMYVAGFIGSPTMNFLPVQIVDGRTAKASSFEVPLPHPVSITSGVLGVRPEALTERPHDGATVVDLAVDVVEVLGSDQFLYGRTGSDVVTARVDPGMKVSAGDHVRLGLDHRHLHLFDAETEQAVLEHL
jgi:multiple sugar transport system ATP-binding protein